MVLPVWCCCMPQDVQVQSCQVPKCPCSAGPVHSRQACGDWGCTPGLVVPCLWSRIMLGRVSGMRVWPAAPAMCHMGACTLGVCLGSNSSG